MASLLVIGYADQGVAEDARRSIQELEDELKIRADQVASISRDLTGRYHAYTSHIGAPGHRGPSWTACWQSLFGLLFVIPAAGLAPSAKLRAVLSHLRETNAGEPFQKRVCEQVKPGTSALFLAVEHDTPDKALAALEHYGGTVVEASLASEELERLRTALSRATFAPAAR